MDFETWQSRLRAENTRKAYTQALKNFLDFYNVTPEESLTWSAETAEERLIDWKESLVSRGKAGHTILMQWAAVKRWFVDNKIRIIAKCEHVRTEKTYLDYIPSRQDVQKLLDDSGLKLRLAIAFVAFSGMRPSDVAGLQYQHIKASFEHGDDVITIVKRHKKSGQWYFTFLPPQGVRYLKTVLEIRKKNGEIITDESYVLIRLGKAMTAYQLKCAIRQVIRRAFTKHPTGESFRLFRPYGLRKYYRRVVSKLGEDTAEFLMGHASGLESLTATYSGLKDLDPAAIDALKQQYIKLLPELETEWTDLSLKARVEELEDREAEFQKLKEKQEAQEAELKRISEVLDEHERKRAGDRSR